MLLSTEQILLLENLMYATPRTGTFPSMESYEGQTIGEWIRGMDIYSSSFKSTDAFMNTAEWKQIIQAVYQEEALMNLTILTTHADNSPGGGGGQSAVFLNEDAAEAIIAFKGTEGANEWADNFRGGNLTDTTQQKNALQWYRDVYREYGLDQYDVTLTGHSKGGNKSKYITLMDETVNRCISFDGQGFSDLFMEKYAEVIAKRQNRIENHNVDYDYVNLLLNDVGETTFYKRYNTDGNILENHCPNAFMKFAEDNSFCLDINPRGQASEMQALDELLNSMLRSMPVNQRDSTLNMLADIVNACFPIGCRNTKDKLRNIVFAPEKAVDIAYLAAYLTRYDQANPRMSKMVKDVLEKFGMGELIETVDKIDGILNAKKTMPFGARVDFNSAMKLLGGVGSLLKRGPNWLIGCVKNAFSIGLNHEEIRDVCRILGKYSENLRTIEIKDNGKDIRIESDPV